MVLAINAVMFGTEMLAGWIAESTALISDSLDMLADAGVYTVALYGAARGPRTQRQAAIVAGWLQGGLAIGAIGEVGRRLIMGSAPDPSYMVGISIVALLANVWCLRLISRHRHAGVHMTASWIFSQNDVMVNISVIVGGALVAVTELAAWDLVLGTLIAILVLSSSLRILRAVRQDEAKQS